MRITLILDKDVAAALKRLSGERNARLAGLINETLRRGIKRMTALRQSQTRSVSLGRLLVPNIDNVTEALAITEQPGELAR